MVGIEYVTLEKAVMSLFNAMDGLGSQGRAVIADVYTALGDTVALGAGGGPPYKALPDLPPFITYEVQVAPDLGLPAAWARFEDPEDGTGRYFMVPKLLICHLIMTQGGLMRATFSRSGGEKLF